MKGRWNRTGSGEPRALFVGELDALLSRFIPEGRISGERAVNASCNRRGLASSKR